VFAAKSTVQWQVLGGPLLTSSLLAHAMVRPPGHGPLADLLEGRGGAGLPGHLPGDVDPPEGMAALRCPHAP